MNSTKHSIRWVALETVLSRGLGLISYVIVARVLGPEAIGIVALVILIKELAELVSDFGLSQAIIHFKNLTPEQLATLYSLNCLLGFIAFCLMTFLSVPMANYFGQPQLEGLIPVAALGFLVAPLGQQVNALLQKAMEFRTLAKITITTAILGMLIAVGGVYSGLGVWALVLSGLASGVAQQLILLNVGLRRKILHGFALKIGETKPVLSFGAYRTGALGLNMINSRVDQFIIGGTLGAVDLGLYAMASRWTLMTMQQLNGIATKVAFPVIANIQDDIQRVRTVYLQLVNRVCTVNAAVYFGLAATAELFVRVVLGPDWLEVVPVLQLMCFYVLLRSLGNLNGPLGTGLGKANWAFYWNLGLLAIIPGTLLIASRFGELGIIVATLIGLQFSLAGLMYVYWTRRLIGPCLAQYVRSVAVPWATGAIMAVFVIGLQRAIEDVAPIIQLIIVVPVGAFVYIVVGWKINKDAIAELIELCHLQHVFNVFTRKK